VRPLDETVAAWVPDYFGDEYLQLYQFPAERTEPEVAFLVAELRQRVATDAKVLDLACGQGRHAVGLAQAGFRVTGLDYQQNLLDVAAQAAAEQGVEVTLVRGDMRDLPFTGEFDAVTLMFTAFGYFDDVENAHVLRETAKALKPGGWLILDVANRDALLRKAQEKSWKRLPDGMVVVSEWEWDVRAGRYTHTQLLLSEAGRRQLQHSVRVYTCTELVTMLQKAGFRVDVLHGGFGGEALTLDAPRLVVIAQKV